LLGKRKQLDDTSHNHVRSPSKTIGTNICETLGLEEDDDVFVPNENVMPGIDKESALVKEMEAHNMFDIRRMVWSNPASTAGDIAFFCAPLAILEVTHGTGYLPVGRFIRIVSHIQPYHHIHHCYTNTLFVQLLLLFTFQ